MSAPGPCPHCPRGTRISRLRLDPTEFMILSVMRLFASSFTAPERQGWLAGITSALRFFGDETGPKAACAILSAVQSIRHARVSPLLTNAPECPDCASHLTDHERLFMLCFRAVAEGRYSAAAGFAMLLCESNDSTGFLRSLTTLAESRPRDRLASDATPGPRIPARLRDAR